MGAIEFSKYHGFFWYFHIFIIANKIKKKRTIPITTPDNVFNKISVSGGLLVLTRYFANNTIIKKKKRENTPIEANITNFKFRFSRDNSAILYFYFIQYTDVFMYRIGVRKEKEETTTHSMKSSYCQIPRVSHSCTLSLCHTNYILLKMYPYLPGAPYPRCIPLSHPQM